MDYGSIISILVALVAIVISLVSLSRTKKFNDRQLLFLAENEKLIQLQRAKMEEEAQEKIASDISLFVYKTSSGERLGIVNSGRVVAEDVTLIYVEQEKYESPFIQSEFDEKIPIKRMHPGEEHDVLMALYDQTPFSFEVLVKWKANGGSEYEKSITVSP